MQTRALFSGATAFITATYVALLLCPSKAEERLGIAFTQSRVGALSLLVGVPEPIASKAKKEMYEARLEEYKHRAVHPLMLQGPMLLEVGNQSANHIAEPNPPNQALEPTTPAVTIPAAEEVAPAGVVAHL